ncbi:hypothetical protein AB1Y20_012410 [Prymnesium parvum]|uniref:Uncharacterized protein n=1 Tax=Prymnesium parvum TaxID=97485 RepID=A0AB34ILB5_PRYPA
MGRQAPAAAQRPQGERTSRRVARRDGVGDEQGDLARRIDDFEAQLQAEKEKNDEWRQWYGRLESKLASDRREVEKLNAEKVVFEDTVKELRRRSRKTKEILNTSTFSERVQELARHSCRMYIIFDLPRLFMSVLKKLSSKGRPDLRDMIRKTKAFQPAPKKINLERDAACARHLREQVYSKEAFALLRLIARLSKRECSLIQQSFKYRRDCYVARLARRWPLTQQWPLPNSEDNKTNGTYRVLEGVNKAERIDLSYRKVLPCIAIWSYHNSGVYECF